MKGFALGLVLKQRQKATRKWPIRTFNKITSKFTIKSPKKPKLHNMNTSESRRPRELSIKLRFKVVFQKTLHCHLICHSERYRYEELLFSLVFCRNTPSITQQLSKPIFPQIGPAAHQCWRRGSLTAKEQNKLNILARS